MARTHDASIDCSGVDDDKSLRDMPSFGSDVFDSPPRRRNEYVSSPAFSIPVLTILTRPLLAHGPKSSPGDRTATAPCSTHRNRASRAYEIHLTSLRSWKGWHEPPTTSKLFSACIDVGNVGPRTRTFMDRPPLRSLLPMARLMRHAICPRAIRTVRPYPSCAYSSASTTTQSHFLPRYRLLNPKSQIPTINPPPSSL